MSFDITTIGEHNYPQLLDLLEICFPHTRREYFEEHQRLDPSYRFTQGHALSDGDQIVSYLQVFHREMESGPTSIPYAGIGDVATHPHYRKRGLSGKLLDASIRYMDSIALPLSMLFTRLHSHYAPYGWVQIPEYVFQIDLPTRIPKEPDGFIVKPFEETDLTQLHQVYRAEMAECIGPEVRSLSYMAGQRDWLKHKGKVRWEVFSINGYPTGYVRTRVEGNELHVLDLCAGTDALDRLTIARILRHAADSECQRASIQVAPTGRFAKNLANTVPIKMRLDTARMMRLNSLKGLLAYMRPVIFSRLREHLPVSTFALEVAGEMVRIEISRDSAILSTPTGTEPLASPPVKLFLSLLMGQPESHQVLSDIKGDREAITALQLLFPQRENITWRADRF
jgi:predicted acetyltransferase